MNKLFPIVLALLFFGLLFSIEAITDYHPNGMPKVIKTFKGSNKVELTKEVIYYSNGVKEYELTYYKGKVKDTQRWNENGEKIKDKQNQLDNIIRRQDNKILYMKYKADSLKVELSNHQIAFDKYKRDTQRNMALLESDFKSATSRQKSDDTDDEEIEVYEDTDFNKFDEFDDDRKTSKFIAFDEAPVSISHIKVKYPSMAKAAGIEGEVVVEFFIDKNGVVTEVEIVSGTGTVLDQAAVEAVKKSTWKPARQRTKKVGVWKKVPIKFSLEE